MHELEAICESRRMMSAYVFIALERQTETQNYNCLLILETVLR